MIITLPASDRSALSVRAAAEADAPAIAAVKSAAAIGSYVPLVGMAAVSAWLAKRANPAFVVDRIRATRNGSGLFAVVERRGYVVGAGLIRREDAGAYLSDMYCYPPQTGAGTLALTSLLGSARDWGPVRALVVADNQPAVEFFTRHGFFEVGRAPNTEMPGDLVEIQCPPL